MPIDVDEKSSVNRSQVGNHDQFTESQDLKSENCIPSNFAPGSIHDEKYRDFWRNELEAGEWVMETLSNGYVIPFSSLPPRYEESNNKSAIQDPEFVVKAINNLKRQGVIAFTDSKPYCVSPLTVSLKTGRDGEIKKRLCWDGSRCVNKHIKEQKVTLSHLQRALEITREKDFQIVYDLKAAYHHIKIHPEHCANGLEARGSPYVMKMPGLDMSLLLETDFIAQFRKMTIDFTKEKPVPFLGEHAESPTRDREEATSLTPLENRDREGGRIGTVREEATSLTPLENRDQEGGRIGTVREETRTLWTRQQDDREEALKEVNDTIDELIRRRNAMRKAEPGDRIKPRRGCDDQGCPTCNICKETGHFMRDCPQHDGRPPRRPPITRGMKLRIKFSPEGGWRAVDVKEENKETPFDSSQK